MNTRPIAARMKEYLFERLCNVVPGCKVLDVFAGTGTIGLEALSRGAESVIFIEQDHRAFDILKKNIAKIGVEEETMTWRANVLRCSFVPKGVDELLPYDLIFFDPPYPMVPGMKAGDPLYKSLKRLAKETVSSPEVTMIFRTGRRIEFDMPPEWELEETLSVSSSTMYIYRKQGVISKGHEVIDTELDENSESDENPLTGEGEE